MRRSALVGSLVLVLFACSDDSPDDGAGPGVAAGGSASTAGGASGAAGSVGSGSTSEGAAGSGGAPGSGQGSSMEAVDVAAPLDPGSAGAPGGSGEAEAGAVADAGAPPPASGVCPPGPFEANPVPAGATAEVVCGGMTFTEGPVWVDRLGTLFFSDFSIGDAASNFTGPIMAHAPGGGCEVFIADAGTNGLALAPDGNLLGARHSTQTLTLFDLETREASVFVADNGGLAFNSPNDIAVRSDGNIYFTDPNYMLGNRTSEQPQRAYRRDPGGALSVIDEGASPNGITLSPDESRLYLAHLGFGGTQDVVVFDVDASGALSGPEPFLNVGSDGMVVDCAGNCTSRAGPG